MTSTLASQYLAQNAGRRYPLADDTSGVQDTSLLDMRITTKALKTGIPVVPYLRSITSEGSGASRAKKIKVTLMAGSDAVDDLVFSVPYSMAGDAPYTASAFSELSFGELVVTASVLGEDMNGGIRMAATTVVCRSLGVDSVQGLGAKDLPEEQVLSGDIVLDPGRNADPYIDGQHVRVDVFKGAGIGEMCRDSSTGQKCNSVMFTINGYRPDSDGEVGIVGRNGIVITPLPDENAVLIGVDSAASEKMTTTCEKAC